MTFPLRPLGDYVEFSNGKSSAVRFDLGVFPVFGSNGLIGWSDQKNAPAATSIIGRVGTYCGSVHFSKKPCWVTDNAIRATARTATESQFWFYAMLYRDLHDLRTGSGQPLINQSSLKRVMLPVPPSTERVKIGAILSLLDDKIELNRKTVATLEEMARALYRSWFVDFGPVRARAEGRAPAHMDPATAALFPDSFGESGLPVGWSEGSLADFIDFNPKERLPKGSIAPYFDMKALPTVGMTADEPVQREFSSGTKFRSMDTLLARITPCLENGKTAMVEGLADGVVAWGSTEFIVMRAKSGVPAVFPYCVARDALFRDCAIGTMTGSSGRQRADSDAIARLPATVPYDGILKAFGENTDSILARIHQIGRENRTLAALRDTLLPRLMSGELRVGAARELVEDAA